MKLPDASRLPRLLMREHEIGHWHFKFSGAKRQFGLCDHRRREIRISRHLTLLNEEGSCETPYFTRLHTH